MPRFVVVFVCALLMFIARTVDAQNVSRAFCSKDGKAHVVYRGGAAQTLAAETQQVGCEHIIVADDGHTVGWSVLVENGGTSYPITTAVVVYRDGKKNVISSDQMIWEWRFLDKGKQVAVLSGPVHGGATAANLHEAHSGKVLAIWDGKGAPPEWAAGWEDQFGERPSD